MHYRSHIMLSYIFCLISNIFHLKICPEYYFMSLNILQKKSIPFIILIYLYLISYNQSTKGKLDGTLKVKRRLSGGKKKAQTLPDWWQSYDTQYKDRVDLDPDFHFLFWIMSF